MRFEDIYRDRMTGEHFKRERGDEFRGRLRHHDLHHRSFTDQSPEQRDSLVGRNTASHAEHDVLPD